MPLPPLPAGFVLDQAQSNLPPLPAGFKLDDARQSRIEAIKASNPSLYDRNDPNYWASPTKGMSAGDKFLSGMGKAFSDVGVGVKQIGAGIADVVSPRHQNLNDLVAGNHDVSRVAAGREAVKETRRLESPLMQTGWGKAGNFAGGVATTLPTIAIPGANTVAGAGLVGAGLGSLQPSTSTKETLLNTGIGGAVGAASQYVGNKIASGLANRAASKQAEAVAEQEANSVRDAVLSEARQAGYTVPPTSVKANAANTALESFSGKAATRQVMSAKNAKVTNRLVAEDLGLDASKPITREALQGVREEAGKVYRTVRSLGQIAVDQNYLDDLERVAQSGADLEKQFPGIGSQANGQIKRLVKSLTPDSGARVAVADKTSAGSYSLDELLAPKRTVVESDALLLPKFEEGARTVRPSNSSGGSYGELLTQNTRKEFAASNLVSASRFLRNRATANYKAAFAAGGNPEKLELAQAQTKAVNAIEDLIERHLQASGNADLSQAWSAARMTIAKSYQAEAALKGGNISASVLAKQLQKGRPLSGGMGTAARFADMFEDVAKLPKSGAGVSKLSAVVGTTGAGTLLATGHPVAAAAAAGAATVPYAIRNMMASKVGQGVLAAPNYAPNLLANSTGQFLARYGRIPATALAIEGGQ